MNYSATSPFPHSVAARTPYMFRMVGHRIRTDVISLLASPLSARGALTMGLLAAGAFVVLSSINITAQGLYYDEIHQVPAALAYVSKRPPYFAMARVGGKPLMTMAYSGAIKSAVYGLYLSFTGSSFTVESWRRLGIAIVAVALPLFSLLARRRLTGATLLIFFGFLLTDATVVLETRHDWGPVALALALRLGFLGVWLYRQGDREIPPRNSLMLGAIVGFSIYEKLSAIVLLPVLVILLCCPERRTARHWGACLIGGLLGGLPLLIANGLYIAETGRLLSTAQVAMQGDKALAGMTYFGREYFALGDGAMVRQCILGEAHRFVVPEAILLVAALSAVLALRWTERSDPRPAILIACYLAVGIGIFLLPNRTGPYHWVIGTPFQYLALSMALVSPDRSRSLSAPAGSGLSCCPRRGRLRSDGRPGPGDSRTRRCAPSGGLIQGLGPVTHAPGRVGCSESGPRPVHCRQLGRRDADLLPVRREPKPDERGFIGAFGRRTDGPPRPGPLSLGLPGLEVASGAPRPECDATVNRGHREASVPAGSPGGERVRPTRCRQGPQIRMLEATVHRRALPCLGHHQSRRARSGKGR